MSRIARQGDLLLVYYALQRGDYTGAESMLKAVLENRPLHPLRYNPSRIGAIKGEL